MTPMQENLFAKIRSLRIMFSNDNCATISSEVNSLIRDMTIQLIDSMHHSAISQTGAKGRWRTTVYIEKEGQKKRKDICAATKEGLYQKLYDFYVGPGSLEEVHSLWVQQREQENLAVGTLQRERQRWEKYIAGSDLARARMDSIDNFQIEEHLLRVIKRDSITAKELREILFLLRKTFRYAFRHKLIPTDPMSNVEINTTGCAPATPKYSKSRVFLSEEVSIMLEEIKQELINIPHNTTALAVQLLFMLGLRVGELVAIRLSDIDWTDNTIHIQRMEQRGEGGAPVIVNHTKKKSPWGDRVLPLGENGAQIIRQAIKTNEKYGFEDEDYLFLGEKGERIHIRAVDNRIRKLCKRAHIEPAKSAHDIRRTVATQLYRKTHDIELVRKYLGHSDIQTTWGYIVDIDAEKEDRERVIDALKEFSDAPEKPDQNIKAGNIISFSAVKKRTADSKKTGHTVVTHLFRAK